MADKTYTITIYYPEGLVIYKHVDDFWQGGQSLRFKNPATQKYILVSGIGFAMDEE